MVPPWVDINRLLSASQIAMPEGTMPMGMQLATGGGVFAHWLMRVVGVLWRYGGPLSENCTTLAGLLVRTRRLPELAAGPIASPRAGPTTRVSAVALRVPKVLGVLSRLAAREPP